MQSKFKIEYLPVKKVKLNPGNPRFIKDEAFKRLVKSLKDCPSLFDARPCVCSDRTGELIVLGGNMRYRAAMELGYKEVPVIIMSGLSEDQEREIAIKDNGDFGEWDFDMLANEWGDLPLADWGIRDDFGCLNGSDREKLVQEDKDLQPYKKIRILISIDMDVADEVTDILDELRKIQGVEIEQGAN